MIRILHVHDGKLTIARTARDGKHTATSYRVSFEHAEALNDALQAVKAVPLVLTDGSQTWLAASAYKLEAEV